ncbi:MAG TPA: HAMP domain-containing sensor histidine kinase [bacterium]|nr:HAMP domain-containing sensor histidine kinase [bacterium]
MISLPTWWKKLAAEESEEVRLFQDERARITRLLLLLGFLMTTFFLALALVNGGPIPFLPIATDLDLLALAYWIDRRPQDYRWVSRLLLFPALGFSLMDMLSWPSDVLAPPLVFLPTLAYFAVLLDGPRAGLLMALGELALLGFYDWHYPQPGPVAAVVRSNLVITVPGYLFMGWVAWRQFRDLGRAVTAQAAKLKKLTAECDQILSTIFRSLEERVSGVRRLLRRLTPRSVPALRREVKAMTGILEDFTTQSMGLYREEIALTQDSPLDQARLQMIRVFAGGIFCFFLAGGLRNFIYFPQALPIILGSVAMVGLLWLAVARLRFPPAVLPWVFGLALSLAFLPAVAHWGREFLAPPLFVIPVLVVAASLTGPISLGLASLGLYLAALAWYFLSPVSWTESQLYVLVYLVILAPDLLASGWIFWRLRHRRLERLTSQAQNYQRSMRMRRRLTGTLLHDMRNPLAVLTPLLSHHPGAAEWGLVREMTDRMADILQNSRTLLDVEGLVPAHYLKPVKWGWLVGEIESLFALRFKAKKISLKIQGGAGLRALALPDLLVNSILANLVSNALKFSPRGSSLFLRAQVEDGEFVIRVRDEGPGFSTEQLVAFRRGQRLTHSPGTEGEEGLGLGLFLSRDYAHFMGGELELKAGKDGGTEAVLRLKKA